MLLRLPRSELAPQRAQMGMVFQLFHLWPHLSVRENVALQPMKVAKLPRSDAFALAEIGACTAAGADGNGVPALSPLAAPQRSGECSPSTDEGRQAAT